MQAFVQRTGTDCSMLIKLNAKKSIGVSNRETLKCIAAFQLSPIKCSSSCKLIVEDVYIPLRKLLLGREPEKE